MINTFEEAMGFSCLKATAHRKHDDHRVLRNSATCHVIVKTGQNLNERTLGWSQNYFTEVVL